MLLQLYPRVHRRYSSLPVFGPIVEDFGTWLLKQGYSTDCIREHFCCMRRIARLLHRRGIGTVAALTRAKLRACAPAQRLDDRRLTASVRLLERYFHLGVRQFRRGFQSNHPDFREIFLRCITPAGVLKATAIAEAFQKWSRRSGLNIASQGVHCLRHSYALQLLRAGLPLKT